MLLSRRCWQILAPLHSLHRLLRRWCGQTLCIFPRLRAALSCAHRGFRTWHYCIYHRPHVALFGASGAGAEGSQRGRGVRGACCRRGGGSLARASAWGAACTRQRKRAGGAGASAAPNPSAHQGRKPETARIRPRAMAHLRRMGQLVSPTPIRPHSPAGSPSRFGAAPNPAARHGQVAANPQGGRRASDT